MFLMNLLQVHCIDQIITHIELSMPMTKKNTERVTTKQELIQWSKDMFIHIILKSTPLLWELKSITTFWTTQLDQNKFLHTTSLFQEAEEEFFSSSFTQEPSKPSLHTLDSLTPTGEKKWCTNKNSWSATSSLTLNWDTLCSSSDQSSPYSTMSTPSMSSPDWWETGATSLRRDNSITCKRARLNWTTLSSTESTSQLRREHLFLTSSTADSLSRTTSTTEPITCLELSRSTRVKTWKPLWVASSPTPFKRWEKPSMTQPKRTKSKKRPSNRPSTESDKDQWPTTTTHSPEFWSKKWTRESLPSKVSPPRMSPTSWSWLPCKRASSCSKTELPRLRSFPSLPQSTTQEWRPIPNTRATPRVSLPLQRPMWPKPDEWRE